MRRVVTIDGPAGAGKSTIARLLADRLGWRFLDTGAMYRAVTLAALRAAIDLREEAALESLVREIRVELPLGAVQLGGRDISREIRSIEVTEASRFIADSPSVRIALAGVAAREVAPEYAGCRHRGSRPGDARFPRRSSQVLSDGDRRGASPPPATGVPGGRQDADGVTFESVLDDIRGRDARDAARAIAPMKPAPDAVVIDSTGSLHRGGRRGRWPTTSSRYRAGNRSAGAAPSESGMRRRPRRERSDVVRPGVVPSRWSSSGPSGARSTAATRAGTDRRPRSPGIGSSGCSPGRWPSCCSAGGPRASGTCPSRGVCC